MNWAREQRMNFITERLAVVGAINRVDLVAKFRISTPQASLDLRQYQIDHPNAMFYDKSKRRYVVAPKCAQCFGRGYVLTDGPPGWEECVQSRPCPNGCKSVNI